MRLWRIRTGPHRIWWTLTVAVPNFTPRIAVRLFSKPSRICAVSPRRLMTGEIRGLSGSCRPASVTVTLVWLARLEATPWVRSWVLTVLLCCPEISLGVNSTFC